MIGNDLYTKILDSSMSYSCGYGKTLKTLKMQWNKLNLICRKLHLKPGMRFLITDAAGVVAIHAAKNYSVEVVGVTISKEQQKQRKKSEKLSCRYKILDYKTLKRA